MKALNIIAGLALVCVAATTSAQSCAGHANAKGGANYDMASLSKELKLTAEQQTAFSTALSACEKDCSAMASSEKKMDAGMMAEKKSGRFNQVITSMKDVLNADQYAQLEKLNTSGKLMGLCGGEKGCCAGKAAKGACCAGKPGAHAEPAKVDAPTMQ